MEPAPPSDRKFAFAPVAPLSDYIVALAAIVFVLAGVIRIGGLLDHARIIGGIGVAGLVVAPILLHLRRRRHAGGSGKFVELRADGAVLPFGYEVIYLPYEQIRGFEMSSDSESAQPLLIVDTAQGRSRVTPQTFQHPEIDFSEFRLELARRLEHRRLSRSR